MKTINELLKGLEYEILNGNTDAEVSDIIYDSRKAYEGCMFFCHTGANIDAHEFIPDVASKRPSAIVVQKDVDITEDLKDICIIKVSDTRYAMGIASAEYFDHPAKELLMIGITGTKGKTSTTSMIQSLLNSAGIKCGTIGTIGIMFSDKHIPSRTTTPESYDIESYLKMMVDEGLKACVMEVSSQALMLNRVAGIEFDYAIFTNMSIDHIGEAEHKDFNDYVRCKSLLFKMCKTGIFNIDDEQYPAMIENSSCNIKTFSVDNESDLMGYDFEYYKNGDFIGGRFKTKGMVEDEFLLSAPGRFSMYNALPVILLSKLLDIPIETVKDVLMRVHVKGRMEPVRISDKFHLLIDYAHNAVSTESILLAMRGYEPGRIVSLFGCGGNRSVTRRYEMGEASGKYADLSIITEDNSRLEDVEDIIKDILVGIEKTDGEYVVIPDRKKAIRFAIENAKDGDIILLLGKGHEDYQDKNGERTPFDERVIIKEILKEMKEEKDLLDNNE